MGYLGQDELVLDENNNILNWEYVRNEALKRMEAATRKYDTSTIKSDKEYDLAE